MKKSFYSLIALCLIGLSLTSCISTKVPVVEEEVTLSKNYKMISIKENLDYLVTDIAYPEFESYPQLNKMIKNTVENNWAGFKSYTKTEWTELNNLNIKNGAGKLGSFEYKVIYEVTYTQKYISVLLNTYNFNGGSHGNTTLIAYNYNTESDKIDNIITATGMTYNEISEICRNKLYKDLITNNKSLATPTEIAEMKEMINDGAFPQPGNYEIFTLNKEKAYVYFEPYSVAPYSYGIQKIEIK